MTDGRTDGRTDGLTDGRTDAMYFNSPPTYRRGTKNVGQRSRLQGKKFSNSVEVHVKYKSPSSYIAKVLAKAKVLKTRSNIRVKVTGSQILVPVERHYLRNYTCGI